MIGTDKQVSWANAIIANIQSQHPDILLPNVTLADWWIKHRYSNIEDILLEADRVDISTSFTSVYPRFNRQHALHALAQLDDFLVLDCETTGVGKQAEVCELAVVDYKSGDVLFNSLLKPYNLDGYESSKAREVNGISSAELANSPTLLDMWPYILCILQSKHITAFNADFDLRMIRNSAYKWCIADVPLFSATCLMKLTTAFLNMDYWVSLDEAADYFVVKGGNRHRALGDTLTTIEVVRIMKDWSEQ